MIKIFLLVISAVAIASAGWVNGYTKANGTYVSGYYRTDPNSTTDDNYSAKGNINPYTGTTGTTTYGTYDNTNSTASGQVIYTGPRGGRYYIDSYGNKVCVK